MAKRKKRKGRSKSRRLSARAAIALSVILVILGGAGEWFVHHSRQWKAEKAAEWPAFVTATLRYFGEPIGDFTDGLGLTGHDAIYEYDTEAPSGSVAFAGYPRRTGCRAPDDIVVLSRGEFAIGWSPSLRHPVWCAYHVIPKAGFDELKRPSFLNDPNCPNAPRPDAYTKSGYDRGHMVPNHAIVTRYGKEAQRKTFMMSNISPQKDSLNRGVWRDVEHRIADLWTAKYGEIWVIVGTIPSPFGPKTMPSGIDIPHGYYQVIVCQVGMDIRALAVRFEQNSPWGMWPASAITSIDDLEEATGLDFLPDLPSFIQDPLEAEQPTRMWPVRATDIFRQLMLHFTN